MGIAKPSPTPTSLKASWLSAHGSKRSGSRGWTCPCVSLGALRVGGGLGPCGEVGLGVGTSEPPPRKQHDFFELQGTRAGCVPHPSNTGQKVNPLQTGPARDPPSKWTRKDSRGQAWTRQYRPVDPQDFLLDTRLKTRPVQDCFLPGTDYASQK